MIGQLWSWQTLKQTHLTFLFPSGCHGDRRLILTHWAQRWSPWRSSHSSDRSLYGKRNPEPPALSPPRSRRSRWSTAQTFPVENKYKKFFFYLLTKVFISFDREREKWGPHESFCHGRLVLSGEMLLQGQDHAVGSDGGQNHVLKRCKGQKVKELSI